MEHQFPMHPGNQPQPGGSYQPGPNQPYGGPPPPGVGSGFGMPSNTPQPPHRGKQAKPKKRRSAGKTLLQVAAGIAIGALLVLAFLKLPDFLRDRSQAWQVPLVQAEQQGNDLDTIAYQGWTLGDNVIRGGRYVASSVALNSGKTNWTLTVPPGNDEVCYYASGISEGFIGFAYGSRETGCTKVGVIDTNSGKLAWDRDFGAEPNFAISNGLLVVAASNAANVVSYDVKTGAQRWSAALTTGCKGHHTQASGNKVAVLSSCGENFKPTFRVTTVDAATGKVGWDSLYDHQGRSGVFSLLSADPVVVTNVNLDVACCLRQTMTSFDEQGKPRPELGTGGDKLAIGFDKLYGQQISTRTFAVVGSTLIVAKDKDDGRYWPTQLVGIDLATGREQWVTDLPSDVYPQIVDVKDKKLTIFAPGHQGSAPQLYTVDATNGTHTAGDDFPSEFSGKGKGVTLSHGDLFVVIPRDRQHVKQEMVAYGKK